MNQVRYFQFYKMQLCWLALGALTFQISNAQAEVVAYNFPAGESKASFESEAPLESFVGTSDSLVGSMAFDVSNPLSLTQGKFSLPVSSIETGIPLRNQHLRSSDWLHADKFSEITLQIDSAGSIKSISSDQRSQTSEVTLYCQFTAHGVTRALTVTGKFTILLETDDQKLIAIAEFPISIQDFGMPSNKYKKLLGSKVGEQVMVSVTCVGYRESK